jgi:tetraacyldisaccharide 4'-kinase
MRPPGFWRHGSNRLLPLLLSPLGAITTFVTAARVARPGWTASVPVICCGNVTMGGAGKTILALDLAQRLQARGAEVHFLSRGHGGRARGVVRVTPEHDAATVGDEPLLLAAVAPTWVAADRAAGARAAIAAGARVLVMDDGLQNPGLTKDFSVLVVDGRTGFGNGHVFPAGPLREPVAVGAARCQAAVVIGADATEAAHRLGGLPVLRAWLTPGERARALAGRRVLAFAGIGFPDKFFSTLADAGALVVERRRFADHHRYTAEDVSAVCAAATHLEAVAVTTAKDAVRLSPAQRASIEVADVGLSWQEPHLIEGWLQALIKPRK